jgi:Spy/CpxP family protein refolding chaperone
MKQLLVAVIALAASASHAQVSSERSADYLSGAGMGYAKPAELNHFPGPMHVLELADKLGLSAEQRATTSQLMDQHKRQARAIGAELVESERALEGLFRKGALDEATLARAVRETAALEGEYRLSHLETHRRMRALLTEEQVKRYDELRGNTSAQPGHKHGH